MGQLLLRESNYSFATSAFVFLNPGKRAATDAIVDAEVRLSFKRIISYHQSHKVLVQYLFLRSQLQTFMLT